MVVADAPRRGRGAAARTRAGRRAVARRWPRPARSIPGVSRNGMTLAAARLRGFDREDANVLSRHVALPVIVGRDRA